MEIEWGELVALEDGGYDKYLYINGYYAGFVFQNMYGEFGLSRGKPHEYLPGCKSMEEAQLVMEALIRLEG